MLEKKDILVGRYFGISFGLNQRVQFIEERLAVETAGEGSPTTPHWYVAHLIVNAHLQEVALTLKVILDETRAGAALATRLADEVRHDWVEDFIRYELEGAMKFRHHCVRIRPVLDGLATTHAVVDMPFVPIEWTTLEADSWRSHRELLAALAATSKARLDAAQAAASSVKLDYAYSLLASACFDGLEKSDWAFFERVFPVFFRVAVSEQQRLTKDPELMSPQGLGYRVTPIIDLLAISGHAIAFGDLEERDMHLFVSAEWSAQLGRLVPEALELFAIAPDVKRDLYMVFPRDSIREAWRSELRARFQKKGLLYDDLTFQTFERTLKGKRAGTPMLRLIQRVGGLLRGPEDCFVALYLAPLLETAGKPLPKSTVELRQAAERDDDTDEDDDA